VSKIVGLDLPDQAGDRTKLETELPRPLPEGSLDVETVRGRQQLIRETQTAVSAECAVAMLAAAGDVAATNALPKKADSASL
jgi:hypothetical protein